MNLMMLALSLLCQGLPERPEDLRYKPLKYAAPDPAALRLELGNGVILYALEDRSLPKVELTVYLRAGSFWEDAGREGLAAMCGTVMRTGGTTTRKPEDLDEELEFLAANFAVEIGDTQGTAALSLLSKDLEQGLGILFDVLRNPDFRQDKIDLYKAQAMERLKARNDSTSSIEAREFSLLLYGDYPVNRLPTGASVQAVTRDELRRFHERFIHPANLVIAASGDFTRADLVARLDRAMKGWKAGTRSPGVPKPAHKPAPGVYTFHKEGKNINQGRVSMAHPGVDLHHPDVFPLRVLNYILGGGGFSSRLVQKVRTESGLAYSVHSDFRPGILYPGTMKIAFQSKSESCAQAAKMCVEELERIRRDPVTEEELAAAKQFYVDAFPGLFFENARKTVQTYANAEVNGYPKGYFQNYREKIAAVTREDILRVAKAHLHPEDLVVVVVGDIAVIREGDTKAKLADLGRAIEEVPLPDPLTLERPRKGAARPPMCDRCSRMMFTNDIGKCAACGGETQSGAFDLCERCARAKGVCMACGAKK